MLSASDIDTYRLCPLKYKFARVFRIPQEPTIHQRFGIAIHQVLERWHQSGGDLMELFEAAWRRNGFGDSDDERQFRGVVEALDAGARTPLRGRAVCLERSFASGLGRICCSGRRTVTGIRTARRADRPQDRKSKTADLRETSSRSTRWGAQSWRPRPRRRATSTCRTATGACRAPDAASSASRRRSRTSPAGS
jgi:hypothetical protein